MEALKKIMYPKIQHWGSYNKINVMEGYKFCEHVYEYLGSLNLKNPERTFWFYESVHSIIK
jgi:hypothetical protein